MRWIVRPATQSGHQHRLGWGLRLGPPALGKFNGLRVKSAITCGCAVTETPLLLRAVETLVPKIPIVRGRKAS